MQEILGIELEELSATVGGPQYRAAQVFEWIYARGVYNFQQMTNLPKDTREDLAARFTMTLPEILHAQQSRDGTTKYALKAGSETIEMVYMPDEKRNTLCISSQAGCSFGCRFCVTARMNLRRNLTAGEIVGEVLLAIREHGRKKPLNIVYMGMGEPLHNYDQVMKSFRVMSHSRGLAISPRRITISTVGLIPMLERMKSEPVIPNLAISLNAPNNELRSDLMPINRLYPIEAIMKTLSELPLKHRQRITFEYVLLRGVNDSLIHAKQLVEVTNKVRSKINIIPFNPDTHLPFERPDDETIARFAGAIARAGRTVSVRRSRGPDISAACGQLGTQFIDSSRIPQALNP